ncbi:Hypothetical predicted protein, partial [Marmota monax]
MLKIIVGDVDEPPLFSMPSYIMEVYENAKIGTIVGTVLAQDPDSANSLVRYFINYKVEDDRFFNIDANTGTIKTSKVLDREETPWYNITVAASENGKLLFMHHRQRCHLNTKYHTELFLIVGFPSFFFCYEKLAEDTGCVTLVYLVLDE